MPRSLMMLTGWTLLPENSRIRHIELPNDIFLRWPRCKGLLVFGPQYSTTMFALLFCAPYFDFFFLISDNIDDACAFLFTKKLRYGPTALTLLMSDGSLSFLESSCAMMTGLFFSFDARMKQGNAKSPSFCSGGTSRIRLISGSGRTVSLASSFMIELRNMIIKNKYSFKKLAYKLAFLFSLLMTAFFIFPLQKTRINAAISSIIFSSCAFEVGGSASM